MSSDCECIGENDTVVQAAKRLSELGVGAMPICGEDDKLKGMLTDRDIVVKVLAKGKDPEQTTAGELAEGTPVMISADDSAETALQAMAENKVRRLPVLDGDKRLVGIVSQADVATHLPEQQTGEVVEAISAAP
jgi:CBS domain-containing protein